MKTIRHGTFETNSSSTHAFSLLGKCRAYDLSFSLLPKDGKITLTTYRYIYDINNNPLDKAQFLLTLSAVFGHQDITDTILRVIAEVTNTKVEFIPVDYSDNNWSNVFCKFTYEDSEDDESLQRRLKEYTSDDSAIKEFIFSTFNPFERYEYYDG